MNTLNLGYKKAHRFVTAQQEAGNNVRWDGWTMVFFEANPSALYSLDKQGRPIGVWNRQVGGYGFETRVSPNNKGLWEVPNRLFSRPVHHTRS